MTTNLSTLTSSIQLTMPAVFLLFAGCAMLAVGVFIPSPTESNERSYRLGWGWGMLVALFVSLTISWMIGNASGRDAHSLFIRDTTSGITEKLTLLGGLILCLIGWRSVPARVLPEHFGCLAILLSGVMFVGNAADWTTLFLALELVSIPTYVLLGIAGSAKLHREATLKYFALSAFSSAIFLFGASYMYGITGTTAIDASCSVLHGGRSTLVPIAWTMILAGLAFRMTAFPFHFYAPDVFAGTTRTMAAALSYFPKVAGLIAILRIASPLPEQGFGSSEMIAQSLLVLSMATMTVGNILAFVQTNIRRLFAYSSVAHTGYLLLGLAGTFSQGLSPLAVLFYLFAYSAMTLGVFAAIEAMESKGDLLEELDDLIGYGFQAPFVSATFTVNLLSLIGLPLTAGFWAKLQVIFLAMTSGSTLFRYGAILLAFNATVAAGYYLPILIRLYTPSGRRVSHVPDNQPPLIASALTAALSIAWFFFPTAW
jgi:NADH-quinone oxidoreductase subunit N